MLDWKEILKVQVLDTSTGLSTINESMIEDENCCENAFQRYKELHDEILNYRAELKKFDFSDSGIQCRRWVRHFLNITKSDVDILFEALSRKDFKDKVCLDFYDFLNTIRVRLKELVKYFSPSLTPKTFFDKAEKIREEIAKIMEEWNDCDDDIIFRYLS